MIRPYRLMLISLLKLLLFTISLLPQHSLGVGQWQLLQQSIGISAMHSQLLSDDRVIFFDRTEFGPSNLSLPNFRCSTDQASNIDCTAHSVEYNPLTNTFRALTVQTNTWCSSGSVFSDGKLVQTGGYNDGEKVVRTFKPCPTCDWVEQSGQLAVKRWYSTNHILPDGRTTIVIGGRRAFSYEFFPKTRASANLRSLPFLAQTNDPIVENNLYPFVFLNVDGNLFIFANNRAILFDYTSNAVVRTYPEIPGGDPRSYPSSGSAVLLPMRNLETRPKPEVLVCGGAPKGSFLTARSLRQYLPALNTCARLKLTDPNPTWLIETMPMARTMGDMVILPNEDVLIINGAGCGTSGWGYGRDPTLSPVLYHPYKPLGFRFEVQEATTIPRMYHSTATLLRDGRVLVAGSNPNRYYNFTNVLFPTELSLEAFSPPYLNPNNGCRPIIITSGLSSKIMRGQLLRMKFMVPFGSVKLASVKVTLVRPPFTTHAFSMNQRLLVLDNAIPPVSLGMSMYQVTVKIPASLIIAPPGFYMMFLVHQDIPSEGFWVQTL